MLQGNLEDLPLLDIIQIVSFSKKTGYLSIQMEGGDGAIVFHEGLLVSAFTANSPPPDPRLAELPRDARESAVRSRIAFAMEQLARLREGAFGFELTETVPKKVGTRDIALEALAVGINPQEMLLELAQGIDEDRAHSAAAVEASFAAPEEAVVQDVPMAAVVALDSPAARAPAAPAAPPSPPATPVTPPVPPAAAPAAPRVAAQVARVGSDTVPPGAREPLAAPAARAAGEGGSRRASSCWSTTRRTCGRCSGAPSSGRATGSRRQATPRRPPRPRRACATPTCPSCS